MKNQTRLSVRKRRHIIPQEYQNGEIHLRETQTNSYKSESPSHIIVIILLP